MCLLSLVLSPSSPSAAVVAAADVVVAAAMPFSSILAKSITLVCALVSPHCKEINILFLLLNRNMSLLRPMALVEDEEDDDVEESSAIYSIFIIFNKI